MSMQRTPQLSDEGTEEILEELRRAPEDTPERRATFARAQAASPLLEQEFAQAQATARRRA